MNIQEALKTLTNETGWTMPKAGADGVFRFHLEDGLELALLSPDGRLCILTSDLGEAPSENDPDYAEKSDRLGTVCAALMPHGRATLSTANERLELVRAFSLDGLAEDGVVREAEAFSTKRPAGRRRSKAPRAFRAVRRILATLPFRSSEPIGSRAA